MVLIGVAASQTSAGGCGVDHGHRAQSVMNHLLAGGTKEKTCKTSPPTISDHDERSILCFLEKHVGSLAF